ncbi:MAG: hypothetical protein ACKO5K_14095 [Armatimonadota bacterium]
MRAEGAVRAGFTLGVALLAVGPACAQTAYGPGGMLVHPGALVRPKQTWDVGLSWVEQVRNGKHSEWAPLAVTGGLTDRLEVGAQLIRRRAGTVVSENGGLFARYRLRDSGEGRPALALVASHVGGPIALSSLSLASTWSPAGLPKGTLVHAGIQGALRADGPTDRSDVRPYVGIQLPIAGPFSLTAEAGARFRFDPSARTGLGVGWTGADGRKLTVGWANTGRAANAGFFVGVGYPIGGGKK